MNNLFVYCEIEEGNVLDVSLELLTKGRSLANQLNCQLEAVVAGTGLKDIEKQILPYGVDKLHVFDGEGLYPYTSLPHTAILVNLFKEEQPQKFPIVVVGAKLVLAPGEFRPQVVRVGIQKTLGLDEVDKHQPVEHDRDIPALVTLKGDAA